MGCTQSQLAKGTAAHVNSASTVAVTDKF